MLLALLASAGCAASSRHADLARQTPGPGADLVAAYSLLYAVVADEAEVAGVFVIRNAGDGTKQVVQDIAATAAQARADLEAMAEQSPVRLDAGGLPDAEVAARQLIAGWQQKKLLFGGDFERNLLLTQAEATQYMAALAQRISETDTDPGRIERMKKLSLRMAELHEQVAARLKPVE